MISIITTEDSVNPMFEGLRPSSVTYMSQLIDSEFFFCYPFNDKKKLIILKYTENRYLGLIEKQWRYG